MSPVASFGQNLFRPRDQLKAMPAQIAVADITRVEGSGTAELAMSTCETA